MTTEEVDNDQRGSFKKRRRRKRRRRQHKPSDGNRTNIRTPQKSQGLIHPPPNYPKEPVSANVRRRTLGKKESKTLLAYLKKLPLEMVTSLYKSTGGQPSRVSSTDRMLQLTVKALQQDSRLNTLIKGLNPRERQSLTMLIQCSGIAHSKEVLEELSKSYGGTEKDWTRSLYKLGELGLVAKSETKNNLFFYLLPEPLIPFLVQSLEADLTIPPFKNIDVKAIEDDTFSPAFDFSLISLATYIDQYAPRLTQQHDIHRQDKEELHKFFSQLWTPEKDIFNFHLNFLLQHGMLNFQHSELSISSAIIEEWVNLPQSDQNALILAELDRELPLVEWLFWVINSAQGEWLPERPLLALYRRWRSGDHWRQQFYENDWSSQSSNKESYSFVPLLSLGFLEIGKWGQEKFYRLTDRAKALVQTKPPSDFDKFYLTPNFEIVAPVGLSNLTLAKLGEIAEFGSCDRANTYKLTVQSIERAQQKGWKRDDVFAFLRQMSQIGLPENIEFTLREWMGRQVEVEFHDVTLITVHKNQIKKFESARQFKPFLLHRFLPGMYAIDATRREEFEMELQKADILSNNATLEYPSGASQDSEKSRLHDQLQEAKELRLGIIELAQAADTDPEELYYISDRGQPQKKLPPRVSLPTVREICSDAIHNEKRLRMMYNTKNNERKLLVVVPERITKSPTGEPVLIGREGTNNASHTFFMHHIERLEQIK